MNTEKSRWLKPVFIFLFGAVLTLSLSACGGKAVTPTTYVPPTSINNTPLAVTHAAPNLPGSAPIPACLDNLYYLEDLTIPDGSLVAPGSSLDKQWLVENNGTCNWDEHYLLRLVAGSALAAPSEQALYPARAGAQAVIRILFTAPAEPGTYRSAWQAYNPQGIQFGDPIFIEIVVP